jgi:hypothetical protein
LLEYSIDRDVIYLTWRFRQAISSAAGDRQAECVFVAQSSRVCDCEAGDHCNVCGLTARKRPYGNGTIHLTDRNTLNMQSAINRRVGTNADNHGRFPTESSPATIIRPAFDLANLRTTAADR